ncbi:hypothetical protein EKO83_23565 [Salmonella enterica]|nr:hypothetical protein [Salmonella enterica]EDU6767054.1 hypothetical protein [Salmonella enterica subsp. enterica serovar 4,[5],12:i:-]EEQ2516481.1 hypothetical protein [Escherichia coli]MDJ92796.1 hypothetical protein [Salmonella enterica subsp. enterica]EAN7028645.1 hypothetical protein [Salmonella enterica]
MLRSQRRGRDPPCWLSEKEPLVGKRRVNFQRCWLPVSRIGLHRRGRLREGAESYAKALASDILR